MLPNGRSRAVLLFAIDRFRTINDAIGRGAGDRLLIAVRSRLQAALRHTDTIVSCSGGEFAILLEDVDACAAHVVAARLTRALEDPFRVGDGALVITASAGIAVADTTDLAGDLLRDAGVALSRARALGRSRIAVFERAMRVDAMRALTLEQELRQAVERESFSLMFQPIVDARSMRVRAFEALLRWERPDGTRLMPADFVPLAEETGLIVPLGEWVIHRACEWLAALRNAGAVRVNVNVTTHQLADPEFPRRVQRALDAAHLDPRGLCLELTESTGIAERDTALMVIRNLRRLGVGVDIDDFGTGYASFDHLQLIAATGLKLDKAFLAARHSDRRSAIVAAMVKVGHLLDMTVTAEGVETPEDLDVATTAGCDAVQGFYIAHPLSAEEAWEWAGEGVSVAAP